MRLRREEQREKAGAGWSAGWDARRAASWFQTLVSLPSWTDIRNFCITTLRCCSTSSMVERAVSSAAVESSSCC